MRFDRHQERGLLAGGLEGAHGTLHRVLPEGIVDVQHADVFHARHAEMPNDTLGLLLVGGAHVEDVGVHGCVHHGRARGRRHQGDPGCIEQRHDGLDMRCAADQEEADDGRIVDEPACVLDGALDLEAVVQRHELDQLPRHTALTVHLVDVQAGAGAHLPGRRGDRAR